MLANGEVSDLIRNLSVKMFTVEMFSKTWNFIIYTIRRFT
jgi:hypothetical protein